MVKMHGTSICRRITPTVDRFGSKIVFRCRQAAGEWFTLLPLYATHSVLNPSAAVAFPPVSPQGQRPRPRRTPPTWRLKTCRMAGSYTVTNIRTSTDILCEFSIFNGTGSVEIWKTRHKISVDVGYGYFYTAQSVDGLCRSQHQPCLAGKFAKDRHKKPSIRRYFKDIVVLIRRCLNET